MTPGPHAMMSWLPASFVDWTRRERLIVSLAGISPDLDGFGWLVDRVNRLRGEASFFYEEYHHYYGHNLFFAILVAVFAAGFAKRRRGLAAALSFLAVHIHFLADLAGSRGPDGYQWPIYYFYPVDKDLALSWSDQWMLHEWPNVAIAIGLIIICGFVAKAKGYSPFEILSGRFDAAVFTMARKYLVR